MTQLESKKYVLDKFRNGTGEEIAQAIRQHFQKFRKKYAESEPAMVFDGKLPFQNDLDTVF